MVDESVKLEWFKGDQTALDMYNTILVVAHTWDDLVDKDVEVTPEAVNQMMEMALVTLPLNPFFLANSSLLYPVLITSVVSYITSTKLERKGDARSLEIAHFLRYAIYMLPLMAMIIKGGTASAVGMLEQSAPIMIRESFAEFYKEHKGE